MVVYAYILMKVKLGQTHSVIEKLRKIPQISNCAVVTGEWDIVAKVEVENLEELYHITSEGIHVIKGLSKTQTCIVEKEILDD